MGYLIAMVVGYVVGVRAGRRERGRLPESVRALRRPDELGDLVAAARSHAGHTLRELAGVVEGRNDRAVDAGLVAGPDRVPDHRALAGGRVAVEAEILDHSSGDGSSVDDPDGDLVDRVRHIFRQRS